MKDLFNDYKKEHSKKNVAIITASLLLAFSFNVFLFGTDTGARLQTSVLNSTVKTTINSPADIMIVSAGTGTDLLKVQTNSHLENVARVNLSLLFDPESLTINDIFSTDKDMEIVKNANVAGVSSITLLFSKPKTLTENTELFTIAYKKKKENKAVLNLAETQFKSADGTVYNLTNTSLEF